jgi:aminoglycoside/choline kinase family phosphotransferase
MKDIKNLLETKLEHVSGIKKIKGEASTRNFYRVFFGAYTLVAMVYPEPGKAGPEVEKVIKMTGVYKRHCIDVPDIKEIIDGHIILQEDLGDLLAQKVFYSPGVGDPKKILQTVADILMKLKDIPVSDTGAVLDNARMKWEMDFFLTHFAGNYLPASQNPGGRSELRRRLYEMVDCIHPINTFAHRDFHSRNMLIHKDNGRLYLVDFQDSLAASPFYDVVSFAFDSYLDMNMKRNIKALGTFGYQVMERKNLSYKKYIDRTLRHVASNPLSGKFFLSSII